MKPLILLSATIFALSVLTLGCASDRNVKARSHVTVGTGGVNVGVTRSGDLPRPGARKDEAETEQKKAN